MGRNFGTTFRRNVVHIPVMKKNCQANLKKGNSIFDHFLWEVQEKLMDRQLKDKCSILQKNFNINGKEEDETSDYPDLMAW